MKLLLLPLLLLTVLPSWGAEPVAPTYFEAGDLKYQYFDGVNYYTGGNMVWDGTGFITYPKVGDICIVAANPDYAGTDLVIPSTVKYNDKDIKVVGIAPEAFMGNTTITSVTFPNTFPDSYGTSSYTAPGSRPDLLGDRMFADCPNLTKVVFSDGMKYFSYVETPFRNCPIAEAVIPTTLTDLEDAFNSSAIKTIDIPEWVTKITFRDCKQLTEIPALLGMTEVPQFCFMGCDALVNAVLPVNAVSIGNGALQSCASLETLVVPDKVTVMGQSAAANCPKLKEVTLGSSLDEFASTVFRGSTAIELIEFKSSVAPHFYELGNPTATAETANIFPQEVLDNALVVVPEGALPNYERQGWFKFAHAQDTPTGVEGVIVEDTDAPAEYFNLRGVQVSADALVPGVYVVRRGNNTSKITVR